MLARPGAQEWRVDCGPRDPILRGVARDTSDEDYAVYDGDHGLQASSGT